MRFIEDFFTHEIDEELNSIIDYDVMRFCMRDFERLNSFKAVEVEVEVKVM